MERLTMKLTGYVTVGTTRVPLNWTITESEITSAGGLGAENVVLTGVLPTIALAETEEVLPDDGYDELTVVDLRVLLSARSEPVYGNKSDLIARLRGWDAAHPEGLSTTEDDGVPGGAQSLVSETDESETNETE